MIEQTRSPLVLSRLEGDAVISYAPKETVLDGQTLVEIIETTYVEFRRARERMVLNTSCTCNACKNIPNLDLKFFVHYGSFLLQDLGTHIELIGNDVNLVHRLTKNTIVEQTVIRAYAAYTEQASEALEIGEFCRTLVQHSESYEEFPGVVVFVQDLNDVWERARTLAPGGIKPEDTLITQSQEFPVPPTVLWDYVSKPDFRMRIFGSDSMNVAGRSDGRIVAGSVYQCAHGNSVFRHTIVHWEPFVSYTTEDTVPILRIRSPASYALSPSDNGTTLTLLAGKCKGPVPDRWLGDIFTRVYSRKYFEEAFRVLHELVAEGIENGEIATTSKAAVGPETMNEAVAQSLSAEE